MQDELRTLVDKGKVALNKKQDLLPPVKEEDGAEQSSFKTVTEPQYVKATAELFDTEMSCSTRRRPSNRRRTNLGRAQEAAAAEGDEQTRAGGPSSSRPQIREEFMKDPDVQPLIEQINEAREAQEKARSLARRAERPVGHGLQEAAQEAGSAMERTLDAEARRDRRAAEARAGGIDQRPEAWAEKVQEAQTVLDQAEEEEGPPGGSNPEPEGRGDEAKNSDQLQATILAQDLTYLKRLQESVKLKLAQLDFEIGQETYRITVQDKAAPCRRPRRTTSGSSTWRPRRWASCS